MTSPTFPAGFPGSDRAVATAASWVADQVELRAAEARLHAVPMLLSLPQSSGAEISEVVQRGLVRRTESETAILDDDAELIVALPQDMIHRSYLQRIIAGYKIVSDTNFALLLDKAEQMPEGSSNALCRSRFVNFDRASFELDLTGSVALFSQIGRVCNLHASEDSAWALCLWCDDQGLASLAGTPAMTAVDTTLGNDVGLDTRANSWCPGLGHLSTPDRGVVLMLTRTLLALGLGLRDCGWRAQVSRLGLIDRDTASPTSCLVFLDLEPGEASETDEQVIDRMLDQMSSAGLRDIRRNGDTAQL